MSKKIDWLPDPKNSQEHQLQGFSGIVTSLVYLLLVLCILSVVYICFEKTELEPSFLPTAELEGLGVQEDLD